MQTEQTSSRQSIVFVRPDEGPVLQAFGDTVQVKLGKEQTEGRFTVCLSSTPPGGGPPPHRHHHEDELFLIMKGRYRFLTNGEWVEVAPGSAVFTPRGVIHTFQNCGDVVSKAWLMTTPSGFETFFGRCAEVFAEATAGPPYMARVLGICGEHGIEFVPPLNGPPEGE